MKKMVVILSLILCITIILSSTVFATTSEENYINVNGENIYFEQLGNENSEKTIILIHGASATAEAMRPLAMTLLDYNVILMDLPGHYRSEGIAKETISKYSKFIKEFIKELKKQQLITDDITLIGHSMGGAIALDTAINKDIKDVKKVVIISSGSNFNVSQDFMDELANGIFDYSFFQKAFTPYTPPVLIEYFMNNADSLVASVETSYIDFKASIDFDLSDKLKQVDVPTLIMSGEMDMIASPELSMFLYQNIKGSHLKMYEKVGHMLPIERAYDVGQDISDFIQN